MRICFATNNQHKIDEVTAAMPPEISIVSLQDIGCFEELPETSDTLEGNSVEKAAYVLQKYHVPCFADDSGLEVNALNGEPGVFSARFAGPQKNSEDNINLLLQKLERKKDRSARFRTVITLIGITSEPIFFEGVIEGKIVAEKRGTGGFGYDPIFQPEGHAYTFAELSLMEKNKFSHRAIAVQKLVQFLLSNKSL
jgi:XTP/dITP diphosphohydrolase